MSRLVGSRGSFSAAAGVVSMISWHEFTTAAPAIARPGGTRLEQTRLVMLGTLRKDGSPRISPVEPYLSQGQLLFGAMSWSPKTRDLLLDPRCVLHSAITGPDAGEPELKLYGRAMETSSEIREGCSHGWWKGRPTGIAIVFALSIDQATLVEWKLEQGRMIVRRWSEDGGVTETIRRYP